MCHRVARALKSQARRGGAFAGVPTCEHSSMQASAAGHLDACRFLSLATVLALVLTTSLPAKTQRMSSERTSATILVYHRFGSEAGTTTVRTSVLAHQLEFLHENGYTVVRLREIVNFIMGHGQLPPRAVAITVDDGHRSVFTEMKPLVESYRVPVTLFIYPSAISSASHALTWQQLEELKATGLFEIQSHTYCHPNFRVEKRRRSPNDYQKIAERELSKSREVLERELGTPIDLLAWPYGIYDDALMAAAQKAGYVAAFTTDRRAVMTQDNVMAVPRVVVGDRDEGKAFEILLSQAIQTALAQEGPHR